MNQIITEDDIRKLGTILSVWAHPDDESFLAAGIIATAVRNGQIVACVTATKGEQGVQDERRWPAAQLGAIRKEELTAALRIIGVSKHHWLAYHDGECADVDKAKAATDVWQFIETYKPDTILTFGHDGWTGHSDHQAVSVWVTDAVKQATKKPQVYHVIGSKENYDNYLKLADEKLNIFFNIDKPPIYENDQCDICFNLPKEICAKKRQALAAQPSQTTMMFELFDQSFIDKTWSVECFKKAD